MARFTVANKINLGVLAGLVLLLGAAVAFGSLQISSEGEARVRLALVGAGTAASLILDPASDGALTPGTASGPGYEARAAGLKRLAATFGLSDLYVLRPKAGGGWEFLYDTKDGPFDTDKGADGGFSAYSDPPAEVDQAWSGPEAVVTAAPYTDEFGTYRSAFLAVPDAQGKPALVVGTDFDLAQLRAAQMAETVFALSLAVGGLVLLLFLSLLTGRLVGTPLRALDQRFTTLSQGSGAWADSLEVRGRDELADLAVAFNAFLEKLHWLIDDLKSGVEETAQIQDLLQRESGDTSATAARTRLGAEALDGSGKRLEASVADVMVNLEAIESQVSQLEALVRSQQTTTGRAVEDQETVDRAASDLRVRTAEVASALGALDAESARTGKRMEASLQVLRQLEGAVAAVTGITATLAETSEATGLLAMNAGIEAAHAGAQGAGFAVIAQRMRLQAETSRADADRIGQNLDRMVALLGQASLTVAETSQGIVETRQRLETALSLVGQLQASGTLLEGCSHRNQEAVAALREDCRGVSQATETVAERTRGISGRVRALGALADEIRAEAGTILEGTVHVTSVAGQIAEVADRLTAVSQTLETNLERFHSS